MLNFNDGGTSDFEKGSDNGESTSLLCYFIQILWNDRERILPFLINSINDKSLIAFAYCSPPYLWRTLDNSSEHGSLNYFLNGMLTKKLVRLASNNPSALMALQFMICNFYKREDEGTSGTWLTFGHGGFHDIVYLLSHDLENKEGDSDEVEFKLFLDSRNEDGEMASVFCKKSVAAQHSPVMKAMLEGGFRESFLDEIEIKECDFEIFKVLISYMKSFGQRYRVSSFRPKKEDVKLLLRTMIQANKFLMTDLMESITKFFVHQFTVSRNWEMAIFCFKMFEDDDYIEIIEETHLKRHFERIICFRIGDLFESTSEHEFLLNEIEGGLFKRVLDGEKKDV